MHNQIKSQ